MNKEKLLSIIEKGEETEEVDFKQEFYKDLKNSDLAKDIVAFANSNPQKSSFIIFGIEDKTKNIIGIKEDAMPNKDSIDDYISHHIDPFINTTVGTYRLECEKTIGYIEIGEGINRPYLIKKNCGYNEKIKQGDIYIRKGATIQKASRNDIIEMFNHNGKMNIRIFEKDSYISPVKNSSLPFDITYGHIKLELFNNTELPILFNDGTIIIKTKNNILKRPIIAINKIERIKEHPYEIASKKRTVVTALYMFISKDCLDIGFDDNGETYEDVEVTVELFDTDDCIYKSNTLPVTLFAQGDILHKVELQKKQKYNTLNKKKMK